MVLNTFDLDMPQACAVEVKVTEAVKIFVEGMRMYRDIELISSDHKKRLLAFRRELARRQDPKPMVYFLPEIHASRITGIYTKRPGPSVGNGLQTNSRLPMVTPRHQCKWCTTKCNIIRCEGVCTGGMERTLKIMTIPGLERDFTSQMTRTWVMLHIFQLD